MMFDPTHIFLVAHLEQILSVALAGVMIGYIFVGRMSAHLSLAEFTFRGLVIGLIFLGAMAVTRYAEGVQTWEVWIGISVAYISYAAGMAAGMAVYDYRLRKALEHELGRPLRGNPRGILKPRAKERRSHEDES